MNADATTHPQRPAVPLPPIGWTASGGPVPYPAALIFMEGHAAQVAEGRAGELVWLIEHPPLYTSGTSTRREDLLDPGRFPVYAAGRGGQLTYHGPGQRIAYVMLDLKRRSGGDVRAFVRMLESWIIGSLALLGVKGEVREGRVGVWVVRSDATHAAMPLPASATAPLREDKIAAIGIRVRRWVSLHGISLNVAPDLSHYDGIVPCGIAEHGVTSLADLGVSAGMEEADRALRRTFEERFGPTVDVSPPALD